MIDYYVVTMDYTHSLHGPFDSYDEAIEVAERLVIRHHIKVMIVREMGVCEPTQPRDVKWTGLK